MYILKVNLEHESSKRALNSEHYYEGKKR